MNKKELLGTILGVGLTVAGTVTQIMITMNSKREQRALEYNERMTREELADTMQNIQNGSLGL